MNVNNFLRKLKNLEKTVEYEFHNKDLLIEALCHPSLKQNLNLHNLKLESINDLKFLNYERLELLGDALLSLVITEIIFFKYPEYSEGRLAKIRAYLVSAEILHKIANEILLGDYILMTFGEENSNGRNNPNNLENSMEALLGAIYLDSNIEIVKKIISKLWLKYLLLDIDNILYDPKTALQEWSQKEKLGIPFYEKTKVAGSSHDPFFTIKVSIGDKCETGEGKTIKMAEKEAARKLLQLINKGL